MKKSIDLIQGMMREKGYPFFQTGNFNLNLVFVRQNDLFTNRDDDELRIIFKENGLWQEVVLKCSTKPGVFQGKNSLYEPIVYKGVQGIAVVKEGHHPQSHQLVDSKINWLQYPYLKQVGKLVIYRDNTRDLKLDKNSAIQTGDDFDIHIHRRSKPGAFSLWTGNYSIGCITMDVPYLDILIHLCRQQVANMLGDRFSITVLEG